MDFSAYNQAVKKYGKRAADQAKRELDQEAELSQLAAEQSPVLRKPRQLTPQETEAIQQSVVSPPPAIYPMTEGVASAQGNFETNVPQFGPAGGMVQPLPTDYIPTVTKTTDPVMGDGVAANPINADSAVVEIPRFAGRALYAAGEGLVRGVQGGLTALRDPSLPTPANETPLVKAAKTVADSFQYMRKGEGSPLALTKEQTERNPIASTVGEVGESLADFGTKMVVSGGSMGAMAGLSGSAHFAESRDKYLAENPGATEAEADAAAMPGAVVDAATFAAMPALTNPVKRVLANGLSKIPVVGALSKTANTIGSQIVTDTAYMTGQGVTIGLTDRETGVNPKYDPAEALSGKNLATTAGQAAIFAAFHAFNQPRPTVKGQENLYTVPAEASDFDNMFEAYSDALNLKPKDQAERNQYYDDMIKHARGARQSALNSLLDRANKGEQVDPSEIARLQDPISKGEVQDAIDRLVDEWAKGPIVKDQTNPDQITDNGGDVQLSKGKTETPPAPTVKQDLQVAPEAKPEEPVKEPVTTPEPEPVPEPKPIEAGALVTDGSQKGTVFKLVKGGKAAVYWEGSKVPAMVPLSSLSHQEPVKQEEPAAVDSESTLAGPSETKGKTEPDKKPASLTGQNFTAVRTELQSQAEKIQTLIKSIGNSKDPALQATVSKAKEKLAELSHLITLPEAPATDTNQKPGAAGAGGPASQPAIDTKLKPEQQEFVRGKVEKLGSVEAVKAAYPNQTAEVDQYANALASQLFGSTNSVKALTKGQQDKIAKKVANLGSLEGVNKHYAKFEPNDPVRIHAEKVAAELYQEVKDNGSVSEVRKETSVTPEVHGVRSEDVTPTTWVHQAFGSGKNNNHDDALQAILDGSWSRGWFNKDKPWNGNPYTAIVTSQTKPNDSKMNDNEISHRGALPEDAIVYENAQALSEGRGVPLSEIKGKSLEEAKAILKGGDTNGKVRGQKEEVVTEGAAPAAPEAKPSKFLKGKSTKSYTAKGTEIESNYAVVEADDLVASHTVDGTLNPDYPQEIQPRNREKATSQLQIKQMSQKLRAPQLGESAKVSSGSPFVGEDGVVESGNGRTLAIKHAYDTYNAGEYRAWLEVIAKQKGIDVDAVRKMKKPVFVRVRKTEVDRAEFAREANQAGMAAMSPAELAKADAARLTDEDIAILNPGEDGNLLNAGNRDFIKGFLSRIGSSESAGLTDANGNPTRQLSDRIQAAIFAKAYGDDKLTSMAAEEADVDIKNIIGALNSAAPGFAKLGDSETSKTLTDAIALVREAKSRNLTINDFLDQQDMFAPVRSADVEALAKLIDSYKRSGKKLSELFNELAGIAKENEDYASQDNLFGDKPKSQGEILKTVGAEVSDEMPDMPEVSKRAYSILSRQIAERPAPKVGSTEESFMKRFPNSPWLRASGIFTKEGEFEKSPNLNPDQQQVEDELFRRLTEDPEKFMQEYLNISHPVDDYDANGKEIFRGKDKDNKPLGSFPERPGTRSLQEIMQTQSVVINPDEGRELSKEYEFNPNEFAGATHEPLSAVTKMVGAKALVTIDPRGLNKIVVLSGGGGSGKGSYHKASPELGKINEDASILFDGTMAKESKLRDLIDLTYDYNKTAVVVHVHRTIEGASKGIVVRKWSKSKIVLGLNDDAPTIIPGRNVGNYPASEAHYHSGQVFVKVAQEALSEKTDDTVEFRAVYVEDMPDGEIVPSEISIDRLQELVQNKLAGKTFQEFQTYQAELNHQFDNDPRYNPFLEGGKRYDEYRTELERYAGRKQLRQDGGVSSEIPEVSGRNSEDKGKQRPDNVGSVEEPGKRLPGQRAESETVTPPEQSPTTELSNDAWLEANRDRISASMKVDITDSDGTLSISAPKALEMIEARLKKYKNLLDCLNGKSAGGK